MSSSPIDAGRSALRAARAGARPAGGWIKRLLPRTLFGRAILILVTPLILVQAVATWYFYDKLWETVERRLASAVAGDISVALQARRLLPDTIDQQTMLSYAGWQTELDYHLRPGAGLPAKTPMPQSEIAQQLAAALAARISLPFEIDDTESDRNVFVSLQLPEGVLRVTVPRQLLFTSSSYVFLMWMAGTALITFAVGTVFMRNQVRSLRRLAIAADAFGKGRDMPNFRPEGAIEVRQAAAAFLIMRERIQRQITQRTEMLAGVSHDLRTPLTRMKLELELLGDAEDIQGLKSDVAEMEQMLEGYLSFARGEGNEAPQVADLVEVLRDAVATARRDGSRISLETPAELHLPIRRDAFRRCLMNLIGNAKRYGGHVWVRLSASRCAAEIIVDDDGPGIPEAEREAVFRPFYRLESSRNMATGGVGLGLTIARDIMRSHGGEATLDAAPQGGLRVRLYLPR